MYFLLPIQEPTKEPTKEPTYLFKLIMFDFEKDRAFLKTKGYTLIDYTLKIKKMSDLTAIEHKVKTTNNGEYVYKKLIVIIRFSEVCKRIRGLNEAMVHFNDNPDGINIFYMNKIMSFTIHFPPNAVVWDGFLNGTSKTTCEICCDEKLKKEMMACPSCVYPCCKDCFQKRYEISDDSRCFGCRHELITSKALMSKFI